MNRESSRSHLDIAITIESTNLQTQSVARGKISFVDLAGSERYVSICVCVCVHVRFSWYLHTSAVEQSLCTRLLRHNNIRFT
jgi:hypothetical protein